MDHTLEELTRFVKGKDGRLASAAAVVLIELAPKDKSVCEALISALHSNDPMRRPFVIEALGRIGTPEAADALMPLIQAGGPTGDDALRAIAHAGSGMLKPLVKALPGSPAAIQPKLAEAIARTGESPAFAALFSEWSEAALRPALKTGLRNALPGLSEKGREALVHQVAKALDTKSILSNEAAWIDLLGVAGEIGEPELLSALQPLVKESQAPAVLSAALHAIGKLKLEPARRGKLADRVLPFLQSADFRQHAEPALSALRGAVLEGSHRAALQKLVGSPHRDVREFAMNALAGQGSSRALSELLECLASPDRQLRDDAARAITNAPNAAEPVAKMLLDCHNGEQCRDLSHALTPIAAHIPESLVSKLAQEYSGLASGKTKLPAPEAGNDPQRDASMRRSALLAVLRATGSDLLAESALKYARKLRQDEESFAAMGLLKSIAGIQGWGQEHKLEIALCGLSNTAPDFSRTSRERDPNLALISELLSSNAMSSKQLLKVLTQDAELSRKTLYYVGFHFCERILTEREFGRDVLLKLSEKAQTEEGRSAKEKLILEGLLTPSSKQKKSLLEQRAEALRTADDLRGKAEAIEELREREHERKAKEDAKKIKKSFALKPVKTGKPAKAVKVSKPVKKKPGRK